MEALSPEEAERLEGGALAVAFSLGARSALPGLLVQLLLGGLGALLVETPLLTRIVPDVVLGVVLPGLLAGLVVAGPLSAYALATRFERPSVVATLARALRVVLRVAVFLIAVTLLAWFAVAPWASPHQLVPLGHVEEQSAFVTVARLAVLVFTPAALVLTPFLALELGLSDEPDVHQLLPPAAMIEWSVWTIGCAAALVPILVHRAWPDAVLVKSIAPPVANGLEMLAEYVLFNVWLLGVAAERHRVLHR